MSRPRKRPKRAKSVSLKKAPLFKGAFLFNIMLSQAFRFSRTADVNLGNIKKLLEICRQEVIIIRKPQPRRGGREYASRA